MLNNTLFVTYGISYDIVELFTLHQCAVKAHLQCLSKTLNQRVCIMGLVCRSISSLKTSFPNCKGTLVQGVFNLWCLPPWGSQAPVKEIEIFRSNLASKMTKE